MHPFRRFLQNQMDARGWTAAELSRRSGVSKAVLSTWLTDDRERLPRPPSASTIKQLADAFGGSAVERVLWVHIAQSMGLPVDDVVTTADLSQVPDTALLRELLRRADARETDEQPRTTISNIDERRARPPAAKRAARRPKDGPPQPIS